MLIWICLFFKIGTFLKGNSHGLLCPVSPQLLLLWVCYYNLLIVLMHTLTARRSISVKEAYDCATAYNKLLRAEEEEVLTVKEMSVYISYFKQTVLLTLMTNVQSKCLCVMFVRCYSLDLSTTRIQSSLVFTKLKALMKSWMNWRVTVLVVLAQLKAPLRSRGPSPYRWTFHIDICLLCPEIPSLTCCSSFHACRVIIAHVKGAKVCFWVRGLCWWLVFTRPNGHCRMGQNSSVKFSVLIPTLPTLLKPMNSKAMKRSGGDSEFDSDIDSPDEML